MGGRDGGRDGVAPTVCSVIYVGGESHSVAGIGSGGRGREWKMGVSVERGIGGGTVGRVVVT